jgi:Winged helix DNA-binding domain
MPPSDRRRTRYHPERWPSESCPCARWAGPSWQDSSCWSAGDLPLSRAIERVAGLQTQYAPSAYVALWSRLQDFRRQALTKALEHRRFVQATLMRATIHIVSAGDYPLFAEGIRKSRQEWLRVPARRP